MKRADAKGSASVRVPSVPAVNGMSDAQHPIDYDDNPVTNEAEAMAVNDACIPDFERVVNYVIGTISSVPEEQKKLQSLAAEFGKVIEAEDYGIWAAGVTDELIEQERARLISEEETDRMWAKDSEFDELQGQFNRQHKGWVRRERQLAAEAKDSEFDWLEERFRMQDESRRARIRYVNDELRASPSHGRHKQTRIRSLYKMVEAMSGNPTLFLSSHRTYNAIRYLRAVTPHYPRDGFIPDDSIVSKTAEKLRQNPQALKNLARFVSLFEMHSSLEARVINAASNGEVHDENDDSETVWDEGMFNRRTFSVRAMPYHPEAGNGYHNATPKPNPTTPLKIVSVPIPEIVVGHSAVSGAPYILSAGRK